MMSLVDGRFAVISDVHGNYQTLKHTKSETDFFLGDAIGYGQNH